MRVTDTLKLCSAELALWCCASCLEHADTHVNAGDKLDAVKAAQYADTADFMLQPAFVPSSCCCASPMFAGAAPWAGTGAWLSQRTAGEQLRVIC